MSQTGPDVALDPSNPAGWTARPVDELLSLPREVVDAAQREALSLRFAALRPAVAALDTLATKQRIDAVDEISDVVPVLFDHRVYKAYPLSLIEKRNFKRLTAWLNRLTTHDLTAIPLDGLRSVDAWLERLDDNGMIIGHSTGTTGKLSFIPRSAVEWPAWKNAYFEVMKAAIDIDTRVEKIPNLSASGYRSGHQMMTKMGKLFGRESAGGEAVRHMVNDYPLSSDLLSLAGRLQAAEERGELDQLKLDPELLKERHAFIEAARHREDDLQTWFVKAAEEFRGQRIRIGGTYADLVRLALKGREQSIVCEFAEGSILMGGGGFKGYKDAPADWRELVTDFFGIDRIRSMYGMSECMGTAPLCSAGYFHFQPYAVPLVLDDDFRPLPAEGVQTGRLALYDLLAETYWGGFISSDRVTLSWDYACECGWKGPRAGQDIARFSELEGGDDKITCAGTGKAYSDFMDYVGQA